MLVELTWRECRLAAFAAVDRRLYHLYNGTSDRHTAPSDTRGWQLDIEGMFGEFVVAKAFDLFWTAGTPKADCHGDVALHQVRSTRHQHGGLIVHPDDPDDVPFVLVVGTPPRFRIPGWMSGREAKQDWFWKADLREPAFLVPQAALRSLDEFVEVRNSYAR